MDSKDPYVAGDEYIDWLSERGRDPRDKLLIASDTLDVEIILGLHAYFGGKLGKGVRPSDFRSATDFYEASKWTPERRIRFSAGWGTLLTNDFRGCNPNDGAGFDPISLICKVSSAEGRPRSEAFGQFRESAGPGRRDRAIPRESSERLGSRMLRCLPREFCLAPHPRTQF